MKKVSDVLTLLEKMERGIEAYPKTFEIYIGQNVF